MISCPIPEISQPLSSQSQSSASFTPQSSLCILHTDRHEVIHRSKDSSVNKKHKKTFRTAKFLFPIQINMAGHYQYPTIIPQISSNNVITNIFDPIALRVSSYSPPNSYRSHKNIRPNHKTSTRVSVENYSDKTSEDQNVTVSSDENSTSEKESKYSSNSKIKDYEPANHKNFEEKINLNDNNDIFDIEFQSSPSASEISKIDISNICFDIVKRGNFPSILVKNGYVEIVH